MRWRRPDHKPRYGDYVSLFFEDDRIGCGWRRVIVISAGHKNIRIIEPTTLRVRHMTPGFYRGLAPRRIEHPDYDGIAARLRGKAELYSHFADVPVYFGHIRDALTAIRRRQEKEARS